MAGPAGHHAPDLRGITRMPVHEASMTASRPGFLGGGEWELTGLHPINLIFGRNGSGKSLLLRKLRDKDPTARHYIVPERSGEISFQAGLITEVIEATKRQGQSQGNFASNYREQIVTRIQGYYTRRGTKRVADIKHDPDDLLKAMSLILPDFAVRVKSESPFYDLRRSKDDGLVTSVSSLSSGESQLLSLGLDIVTIVGIWELDGQAKRILLVDEPDAHIHPDLQIKLADFLCHIERAFGVQVFVATHSTTLMAALGQFARDKLGILYLLPEKKQLVSERYTQVAKELAALLGGHLLMGPLFGAPIMLVEGDDDYRVWVQVARSGKVNLCVLPCNGDEIKAYQRSLERMFAALSETAALRGFALVDGDKYPAGVPPAEHVPFVRLNCHETENLYLCDEVLQDLGCDWVAASARIVAAAGNFGMKEPLLRALVTGDRRTMDIKAVIAQVAEILDPKQLLWTVRVGRVLGRGRPTGMLADFLGSDLVDRVWPEPPTLTPPAPPPAQVQVTPASP